MDSTEAELESFRQKWREEVTAKARGKQPATAASGTTRPTQASSSKAPKNNGPDLSSSSHVRQRSEEIDDVAPHVYHDLGDKQHGRRLDETSASAASQNAEPKSALEHYERAVEKETQGSLGDSLNLYRKAFKV